MKYTILTILFFLVTGNNLFPQTTDRHFNPSYVWTTFKEDFTGNTVDRKVWLPTTRFKRGLGFLIDSAHTIRVRKGNLLLKMKRMPNHSDSMWHSDGWKQVKSDYVGGEISSIRKFKYGIFECRAKYAHKRGSWPAFWLIGNSNIPCPPGGSGSEIDIAELAREGDHPLMMHVIHYYYPPKDCKVSIQKNMDKKIYPISRLQKYYTFKCIWTPEKIQYFIDNELQHEVINNNYEWFPKIPLSLILSQQVLQAYDVYGEIKPKTPQTSRFEWVNVKEFFLAPEITCPASIPQQATVNLDVDSRATDISWELSPSSMFTKSEGNGKTVTIARVANSSGPGKITYRFSMPSGETFSVEKNFN